MTFGIQQPLADELSGFLDDVIAIHQADFGNVQLYDARTSTLRIAVQRGFDQSFLDYFREVRDNATACGRARSGSPVIVADIEHDPAFAAHRVVMQAANVRACQSTPIMSDRHGLLGVVSTHFRNPTGPRRSRWH